MDLKTLNPWAILVAALSAFVVGGLWYSVLFGRVWRRANGFEGDGPKAGGGVFAASFVLSLMMAVNLAMFLNDPKTTLGWGATAGFLAGFGWVALSIAMIGLFERRTWKHIFING